eukprot:TRINITY_DN1196_c0_g1_i3.p1 TRINITY_DN1196_c0_g1~~TRINITY_DN1196_c0_g1_i3.p1  ORF type:complete len:214 (-),score=34.17 TRINITY_DN1196_c0_g1_i3:23-664(-)
MVDQTWEKTAAEPDDPPLTERGILQARKTGQKLRTEPHKIEHIFCSPFLRCLQTATEIAEELDLQIKVEYGLSEWFKKSWFTKMPALDLNVIQSAFSRVDKSYKSFYELKNFPESLTECCLRFEKTTLNLITNFMEKDKNILLVSHGVAMEYVPARLNPNLTLQDIPSFCCITRLDRRFTPPPPSSSSFVTSLSYFWKQSELFASDEHLIGYL